MNGLQLYSWNKKAPAVPEERTPARQALSAYQGRTGYR
ncbi:hypothetical protein C808_02691 [Lachnospiraceae bacterium M18-1]|nr:hypothetical protein C808_02691 [Lachnospiraceae bacterium M18-1]